MKDSARTPWASRTGSGLRSSNWRNSWPVKGRTDYAGLISRENRPKAAFIAVLNRKEYIEKFGHLKQLTPSEDEKE